jgi:hypothetical protein
MFRFNLYFGASLQRKIDYGMPLQYSKGQELAGLMPYRTSSSSIIILMPEGHITIIFH